MDNKLVIPEQRIENVLLLIRGQKVIMDKDLALLYGVTTGNLNSAAKRNAEWFPEDFMVRLTQEEMDPCSLDPGLHQDDQNTRL